jgi:hypothetical protein
MVAEQKTGVSTPAETSERTQRRRSSPRSGGGSRLGSTHEIISGVRRVKGYPLSRDELFELGGAGILATTCFSIGGTNLNRSFDIQKDLEIAQGIPPEIKVRWETKEADAWVYGWLFFIIGIVCFLAGGAKVISIIRSTRHPDE